MHTYIYLVECVGENDGLIHQDHIFGSLSIDIQYGLSQFQLKLFVVGMESADSKLPSFCMNVGSLFVVILSSHLYHV